MGSVPPPEPEDLTMGRKVASVEKGDAYIQLIERFRLRPLRSKSDWKQATAIMEALYDRDDPLDPGEQDYLDCLVCMIELYEEEHHEMPAVSGADMLRHLMAARDETLSQVAAATDIAISSLSSVMTGSRSLTLKHIKALAAHFHVEPAVFLD